MKQNIFIPWYDSGCPHRQLAFEYTVNYYKKHYEVNVVTATKQEFSRAKIRNKCFRQCNDEILIIIDADLIIPYNQIEESINSAKDNQVMVKPYSLCGYLNSNSTKQFMLSDSPELEKLKDYKFFIEPFRPAGGAFVIQKALWDKVGGMNENFKGWGQEDNALMMTCAYKLGTTKFVEGPAFHLFHPTHRHENNHNSELFLQIAAELENGKDI